MKTTEKLIEKLLVSQQKQVRLFCPVIRATCRPDCVCYYEGKVHLNLTRMHEAGCTHRLISGCLDID